MRASSRAPALVLAAGLGLAGCMIAGCILIDALVQSERPFAFSHRIHVVEEGLDCVDCHSAWEDADDPGLPLPGQCALCHAGLDAEKPPERTAAALFEGQRFKALHAGRLSDEILFSHRAHATRGDECSACHATLAENDGLAREHAAELALDMERCLACHAAGAGPREAECAACHREIRAEVPPSSHRANWKRYHGTLVRARDDSRTNQCALCHQESSCESCHHVELPESHDNFWRRRGHGLTASMDRDSCATCHDSDSCDRCHQESRPLDHRGLWGAPRDLHCLTCHEPLRSEACSVCHAATPSHALATPLPGDHLPGMNCRQCHGSGQPLPHLDNGQSCTACHH